MNPLHVLRDHLAGLPELEGYDRIFYRWYDEDLQRGAPPFLLLRPDGGGVSHELMQQIDVRLAVCHDLPSQADSVARAIKQYLIDNHSVECVCNFQILADVTGPFLLNNERNVSQLTVRLWT